MATVDYPGALDFIITDPAWVFTDALLSVPSSDLTIVNHKTACGAPCTATGIAQGFQSSAEHKSAHFVVGRDGSVLQVVLLKDGAGANCCLQDGHNSYWDQFAKYGNYNLCTFAIEHEDWSSDNSQPMPNAQVDASNALNLWLVKRYHLSILQIHSHASMRPGDRARCPGPTFNFTQLFDYINKGLQSPMPIPNPHIVQAAKDTWNSFQVNGAPLRYDTGIANAWTQRYVAGHNMPAPSCAEYPSEDWAGNPIIVQLFGGRWRVEWKNGGASWFTF